MISEQSNSPVVSVTGRLTMATSGAWLKKILTQKPSGQNRLLIDLQGVTEVDSSALAFVTSARRLLAQQGCRVEWLNVPVIMHGVAAIYDADTVFASA